MHLRFQGRGVDIRKNMFFIYYLILLNPLPIPVLGNCERDNKKTEGPHLFRRIDTERFQYLHCEEYVFIKGVP